jgi:hypothetical protein
LFCILILEMYSGYLASCKQQLHSESINIIHHKICTWFRHSMVFSKAHSCKSGYTEKMSPSWIKEGETLTILKYYF